MKGQVVNRANRIQSLFVAACDLENNQRRAWLEQNCREDNALVNEVMELLGFHDRTSVPLDSAAVEFPSGDTLGFGDESVRSMVEVPGYSIGPMIGDGGQAIVFQAIQESTEQKVAIKLFRRQMMGGEKEQRRQKQEIDILAQLDHPHIIGLIDSGRIESSSTGPGGDYIVTPFVEGISIDKYTQHFLRPNSDSYPSEILELFLKVCNAVAAAHRNGIVHRDLKPANILVDIHKEPRILDFGIAKSLQRPDMPNGMTIDGEFLGTVLWMSPEQAAGENQKVGPWTDTYALGVILYQLLTGELPFEIISNFRQQLDIVLNARLEPPSRHLLRNENRRNTTLERDNAHRQASLLNQAADAITMKALSKSIEARYQDASELACDIKSYLRARPIRASASMHSPPPPLPTQRPRRKKSRLRLKAFGFLTILALLACSTFLLVGQEAMRTTSQPTSQKTNGNEGNSTPEKIENRDIEDSASDARQSDVDDSSQVSNQVNSPDEVDLQSSQEATEPTTESTAHQSAVSTETDEEDGANKGETEEADDKGAEQVVVEVDTSDTPLVDQPIRTVAEGNGTPILLAASEGQLGSGEPAFDEWVYHVESDGRLCIGLDNLSPEGTTNSNLASFSIDGERVGYPPSPGGPTRVSDFKTVRQGQEVKIRIVARSGHNVRYRLAPEFENLAKHGLSTSDAKGGLVGASEGTLGFGQPAFDEWEYQVEQDGRVKFSITNLLPEQTRNGDLAKFLINGDDVGYPPKPGAGPRWSEFQSVKAGDKIKVTITSFAGHNLIYQLEPEFESLSSHGLEISETSGSLQEAKSGTLGFGQPSFDDWVFTPPEDGRLRIGLDNLIPESTDNSVLATFLINGEDVGYPPKPGNARRWSDFLSVSKGDEVKIRITGLAENHIIYRLDPEFRSLSDFGLTTSDQSGRFSDTVMGTLGFGQPTLDEWEFTPTENGTLRVGLDNLVPEGTTYSSLATFRIDGTDVGYPPRPGGSRRWSEHIAVTRNKVVRITITAPTGHNVIYRIEPEFEADSD